MSNALKALQSAIKDTIEQAENMQHWINLTDNEIDKDEMQKIMFKLFLFRVKFIDKMNQKENDE